MDDTKRRVEEAIAKLDPAKVGAGTYAATFKDEGEVAGIPVGPVRIEDRIELERLAEESSKKMVPFGDPLPGVVADLGMLTKPQALWVARRLGTELSEY